MENKEMSTNHPQSSSENDNKNEMQKLADILKSSKSNDFSNNQIEQIKKLNFDNLVPWLEDVGKKEKKVAEKQKQIENKETEVKKREKEIENLKSSLGIEKKEVEEKLKNIKNKDQEVENNKKETE